MRGCESQGGWLVGWLGFNGILSTQVAAISQGGGSDDVMMTKTIKNHAEGYFLVHCYMLCNFVCRYLQCCHMMQTRSYRTSTQ